MGLLDIKFDLLGDDQVRFKLGAIAARVQDLSPAWDPIHRHLMRNVRRQFDSEGSGPRGRWEPLSEDYAEWKDRRRAARVRAGGARIRGSGAGGHPYLVLSGQMKASLLDPAHPEHVYEHGRMRMAYGTSVNNNGAPYPRFHQLGTSKMPARWIFDLYTRPDQQAIWREIHRTVHAAVDIRTTRPGRARPA